MAADVRPIPRSLQNIYAELHDDLGIPPVECGDLTPWFTQGVLLLNRVLTVQPGRSGSHRGRGWEAVTSRAIEALVERGGPLVAILWGRDAQALIPMLGRCPMSPAPTRHPLSARAGFFGSRPFSRANELLVRAGAEPIDWSLGVIAAAWIAGGAILDRSRSDRRLVQVCDQVFDVFDADAEPNQSSGTCSSVPATEA